MARIGAGDSAGGNLALAATIALRDAGNSPIRGTACLYGCYAPDLNTQSEKDFGGGPYLIMAPEMAWYWNHYLPNKADRTNPLAAPLYADLSGLPPLFVTAAECDPLRNDSEVLIDKLKAAGADYEFRLWSGTVHACVNLMGWIPAMGPRVDEVCTFLRRVTERA
jgi:acetyl esterase